MHLLFADISGTWRTAIPYSATPTRSGKIIKSISDQMPPCGTPAVIGYKEDSCQFAATNNLSIRKIKCLSEK